MASALLTVVETASYLADAKRLLDEEDRVAIVDTLAVDPEQGDLIRDGRGIRKARFGLRGRGKRGGVRVIYFYHSPRMPVFLLALFAKNERADLTK